MQKYKFMRVVFCLVLPLILVLGCISTVSAKKKKKDKIEVVEAEGLAPLTGKVGQDRKNAVGAAQKRAVELVVGVYVSADSLVSKAMLIEDNITSQTEGFIKKYKILKEKKDEDFYRVKIKAWVKVEDLNTKISNMDLDPEKYGNPSMAFWIDEIIDNESAGTNTVEIELMKPFVDAGFVVSDQKPRDFYKSHSSLLNDDLESLEQLASDIVVLGNAQSVFNTDQGLGGLISYRATVSLKIMMTSTREIITTKNETASGIDITKPAAAKKALESSAGKASKGLSEQVHNYLKERAFPVMVLKNIEGLPQLKRITRSLKTFPTVKDCWTKKYAEGVAQIAFNLKRGTLEEVAKMLEINDNWKFKVLNVGRYELEAEIISEKE